jgi:hydroxyacylglutathione hydrolase
MFKIIPIKAFSDNYIWTIIQGNEAIVVDPGDPKPVIEKLNELNLSLKQIMVTHHHFDHSGGVLELQKAFNCPAYGPKGGHIKGITNPLNDNEHFNVFDQYFMAMASPGHTNDQLAYFCESEPNPILFSGDTLFAAGCGRLFEGTPAEMHNTLSRFSALPLNTLVYCGHEYTESNLNFAIEVEPNNVDIQNRLTEVKSLRDQNKVTLPSTIELELKTNPFMRCDEENVIQAAIAYNATTDNSSVEVLGTIRNWKDNF